MDPYQILGISPSATDEQVTAAYRALARKYHPDLNPGDKTAEEKMKEINGAYEMIKEMRAKGTTGGSSANGSYYGSSANGQSAGSSSGSGSSSGYGGYNRGYGYGGYNRGYGYGNSQNGSGDDDDDGTYIYIFPFGYVKVGGKQNGSGSSDDSTTNRRTYRSSPYGFFFRIIRIIITIMLVSLLFRGCMAFLFGGWGYGNYANQQFYTQPQGGTKAGTGYSDTFNEGD